MDINDKDLQLIADTLLNRNNKFRWNYFELELSAEDLLINTRKGDFEKHRDYDWPSILRNITGRKNYHRKKKLSILLDFFDNNPSVVNRLTALLFKMDQILNKSDAKDGMIGKFNERNRAYRNSVFLDRMKKEGRRRKKLLLVEGDSWFQFPGIFLGVDLVKDVIDHLMDEERYLIFSLAYGGDWLSNIFSLHEYIDELPKLCPDAFLISGGGNDLVGGMRLATLVHNPFLNYANDTEVYIDSYLHNPNNRILLKLLRIRQKQANKSERNKEIFNIHKYKRGLTFISNEFFQFVNIVFVQYFLLIHRTIHSGKNPGMKIVTQGYDFVIPKKKRSPHKWPFSIFNNLVNAANENGNWLNTPLRLKGIDNEDDQEAVLYVIIYEFNEMLIQLAEFDLFENVFHIDNRGMADYFSGGWFDELHPTSKTFARIAELYKVCIDQSACTKPHKNVFTKADLPYPLKK